ncbi:MAG: hypothetical protein ABSH19_06425 [Opitutales bacterium]
MPAVYLMLGLPGSGRREVLLDLIEGGLPDAREVVVYHAAGDEAPGAALAGRAGITLRRYTWTNGRAVTEEKEGASDAEAVFFLADGRVSPIDQLEAFPAWLAERGWKLTRILLVVHCALAAAHREVAEWHEACGHFADCLLLNRREGVSNAWLSEFRRKFTEECHPGLFAWVKQGRVDNAPLLLFPESRRLSLVFDELDPLDDLDEDDDLPEDPLALENKPDPYFERSPSGHRRKAVPDVTKFLPAGDAAAAR